jgi:hypothetical protein
VQELHDERGEEVGQEIRCGGQVDVLDEHPQQHQPADGHAGNEGDDQ